VKGIVLAGGLGSRLRPLTAVTNKHLLPVYNQPMIYYPIQTLVNAGITDIMIVTGGNSAGDFLKLLGNGKAFGLKDLNYTYQEGETGSASASPRSTANALSESTKNRLSQNLNTR
jgi:glucose-1-phosphate thymidylyltransferase